MRCGKVAKYIFNKLIKWSQPARMRCGKDCVPEHIRDAFWSQPARMRCGKGCVRDCGSRARWSQPARMRCGKADACNRLWRCGRVATRTNALWQRSSHAWMLTTTAGRNPHECAVAKAAAFGRIADNIVATRANALWQSHAIVVPEPEAPKT